MKKYLTTMATWWIERQARQGGITDPYELPWIDASGKQSIIIPPGVIPAPGLLIETGGESRWCSGPDQLSADWGMKDGANYLIGKKRLP